MKASTLDQVFEILNDEHHYLNLVKTRVCKITLGSSIIRAFASGTKLELLNGLNNIETDDILQLTSQEKYNKWHRKKINNVYNLLKKVDSNIIKHSKIGLKWGHATKIWNIYIGLLIFYSPYFKPSTDLENVKHFLHIPLDKKAFSELRSCGIKDTPKTIKSVTEKKYYQLQKLVKESAAKGKLPPFYFDE